MRVYVSLMNTAENTVFYAANHSLGLTLHGALVIVDNN